MRARVVAQVDHGHASSEIPCILVLDVRGDIRVK